jgi:ubiquinone/menaquinone biosynthesis C-methylase UbiE
LVAEGVRERCQLATGDMKSMPFPDASFDLFSSLAIHNMANLVGRSRTIDEIARLLAPDGRVVIADLAWTRVYARGLSGAEIGFMRD